MVKKNDRKLKIENVLNLINNRSNWDAKACIAAQPLYNGLAEMLEDIDWSAIAPESIIPTQQLRAFVRSIENKEVRLDVMNFLKDYAITYFTDGAESLVVMDYHSRGYSIADDLKRNEAKILINRMIEDLLAQIKMLQDTGQYSGERFSVLERKITELQGQIETLQEENQKLRQEIDGYKRPSKIGKYVPIELREDLFHDVMEYLISQAYAQALTEPYNGVIAIRCYIWYGSKGLFGYLVDRVSHELDLRDSGGRIQWKLFKPAFHNFDELIKEARNVVARYSANSKERKPEHAEVIEEAIKYAEKKALRRQTPSEMPQLPKIK